MLKYIVERNQADDIAHKAKTHNLLSLRTHRNTHTQPQSTGGQHRKTSKQTQNTHFVELGRWEWVPDQAEWVCVQCFVVSTKDSGSLYLCNDANKILRHHQKLFSENNHRLFSRSFLEFAFFLAEIYPTHTSSAAAAVITLTLTSKMVTEEVLEVAWQRHCDEGIPGSHRSPREAEPEFTLFHFHGSRVWITLRWVKTLSHRMCLCASMFSSPQLAQLHLEPPPEAQLVSPKITSDLERFSWEPDLDKLFSFLNLIRC